MSKANSIGILKSHHDGRYDGRGIQDLNIKIFNQDVVLQEHLYILNNISEVQPCLTIHKSLIKEKFSRMSEKILLTEQNKTFITWFYERDSKESSASKTFNGCNICLSLM